MTVTAVIPQLRTTDLDASIEFYVDTLGFTLEFRYSDFYAGINAGGHTIHLKLSDTRDPSIPFVTAGDHLHLYFEVDDVATQAQRLRASGVEFHHELTDTAWGTREFTIVDDQGHLLCFGEMPPTPH